MWHTCQMQMFKLFCAPRWGNPSELCGNNIRDWGPTYQSLQRAIITCLPESSYHSLPSYFIVPPPTTTTTLPMSAPRGGDESLTTPWPSLSSTNRPPKSERARSIGERYLLPLFQFGLKSDQILLRKFLHSAPQLTDEEEEVGESLSIIITLKL